MIEQATAEAAVKAAAAAAALQAAREVEAALATKFGKGGLKYEVQVDRATGTSKETITSVEIAKELGRKGITVSAADIAMPEMNELGSTLAKVHLHPEVTTMLKV